MIETIVEDDAWEKALPDAAALAARCADAAGVLEPRLRREMALLLTADAAMADLNRRFRKVEKPTNVLSFPSGEAEGFLGDIALAIETCAREAGEKGISLSDHAAHLIVHGMLHLIGYDHQTDAEAERMERREAAILEAMGVADPYAPALEADT